MRFGGQDPNFGNQFAGAVHKHFAASQHTVVEPDVQDDKFVFRIDRNDFAFQVRRQLNLRFRSCQQVQLRLRLVKRPRQNLVFLFQRVVVTHQLFILHHRRLKLINRAT